MTDYIETGKMAQSKKWAEKELSSGEDYRRLMPGSVAAAEVIRDLPDTIVDGDDLREVIDNIGAAAPSFPREYQGKLRTWLKRIETLLPAPAPRTLADMDDDDRAECLLMQATFVESHHEHVIIQVFGTKARLLRKADGMTIEVPHDEVIPRPDLPRMVWPSATPTGHEGVNGPFPDPEGLTTQDPHTGQWEPMPGMWVEPDHSAVPEPQPGECWLIEHDGAEYSAVRNFSESGCEWSADDDHGGYLFDSSEVRLIGRIDPSPEPRKLVTEADYRDAPRGAVVLPIEAGKVPSEKSSDMGWYRMGLEGEISDAEMADRGHSTALYWPGESRG